MTFVAQELPSFSKRFIVQDVLNFYNTRLWLTKILPWPRGSETCSTVRSSTRSLRSEISYRPLATFQNIGKTIKQATRFQSNMYFVRILIQFYTYSNNSQTLQFI